MIFCRGCGKEIHESAVTCPHCGALQQAQQQARPKSQNIALILAGLLGGWGAHRFYLGKIVSGVFYFLFCWTLIPGLIAFVECFIIAFTNQQDWAKKYNNGVLVPPVHIALKILMLSFPAIIFLGIVAAVVIPAYKDYNTKSRADHGIKSLAPKRDAAIDFVMVRIPGMNYELGKFEVTQGEWKAVMGSHPPELFFENCGDTCPVESVSWNDAQEFIQKLNSMTGKQYRLPTEAEWEYACYGGNQTEYCGSNNLDAVAWYAMNSGAAWYEKYFDYITQRTHPVGQKQANGYGLYDMSGNVCEWTSDCGEGGCAKREHRGGSWISEPKYARAAYRDGDEPANRDIFTGFRLARMLP